MATHLPGAAWAAGRATGMAGRGVERELSQPPPRPGATPGTDGRGAWAYHSIMPPGRESAVRVYMCI